MTNLEIIQAFASGSAQEKDLAAREFLRLWVGHFVNLATRFQLQPADRENIQQNIVLKLILKAGDFRSQGEGQVAKWIQVMSWREFLDNKRSRRLAPYPGLEGDAENFDTPDRGPPEDQFSDEVGTFEDEDDEGGRRHNFGDLIAGAESRGVLERVNLRRKRDSLEERLSATLETWGTDYCRYAFHELLSNRPRIAYALVLHGAGYSANELAAELGLKSSVSARVYINKARRTLLELIARHDRLNG